MTTVLVFDPAMCCSTGVCGPSLDPQLIRFTADLEWLESQGVHVERFNLSQEPGAFAKDATVKEALESQGVAALPLIKVNGEVKISGVYPPREELAAWIGVEAPAPSLFTEAVAELVAIGAAIASNCEPCFKFHYDRARKLRVSREDMMRAVTVAQNVKDAPAGSIRALAERYLRGDAKEGTSAGGSGDASAAGPSGCCGSATADDCCQSGSGQDAQVG